MNTSTKEPEQPRVHVEVDAPANDLPTLKIGAPAAQKKEDPAVAGYSAKEILSSPLTSPRPYVPTDERRHVRFLGSMEIYRRILLIVGAGCFALGVLVLVFGYIFSALIIMILGILLIIGALVGKMFQADSQKK